MKLVKSRLLSTFRYQNTEQSRNVRVACNSVESVYLLYTVQTRTVECYLCPCLLVSVRGSVQLYVSFREQNSLCCKFTNKLLR
jgi:ribosomal protein S27E